MKTKLFLIASICALLAGCPGSGGSGGNDLAPTISAIADQSTSANVPGAGVPFTVTDDITPAANLTINVSSSDTGVVPDAGLVVNGAGQGRTLVVTPVVDVTGDTLVSLTVTDSAGQFASTSFTLTVVPQQLSFLQFFRSTFADSPNDAPRPINAIAFTQDAGNDNFADLLAL